MGRRVQAVNATPRRPRLAGRDYRAPDLGRIAGTRAPAVAVWHRSSVDPGYYDAMRGRLLALLMSVEDRLSAQETNWAQEFLDHNELGLALEMIADWLSETEASLSAGERSAILKLASDMAMTDGRVERAIAGCPPA